MGFRFRPCDDELISYLLKFVLGKPFECDDIRQIDLYGNKKPCDIFGDLCDASYFFTQLKRKSTNGKNFNRRVVGGGTWKGSDKGKPISNKRGSLTIGFKKSYRFYDKDNSNSDQRIVWIMKEYFLSDTILKVLRKCHQIRHEDYVLCRIKRKVAVHGDHQNKGLICSSINSDEEAENIGSMSCVRQNQVNFCSNSQEIHVEITSPVYEQPMDQVIVHGHDQYNGFCAISDADENIGSSSCLQYEKQVNFCSNSHEINPMEITSPVLEQPMLGYQNNQDIDYIVLQEQMETGSYCWLPSNTPNSSCDQDQEQFERAKANVPSVEQSLSELNNFLCGDDQYNSLQLNLVPTESNFATGSNVEFSEQRVLQGTNMMMSPGFSSVTDVVYSLHPPLTPRSGHSFYQGSTIRSGAYIFID
ncbi:hypothetical protein RND71_026844 [Anisodus tanguticus]|uniref:NAC domain-containing protein n=1 Tax=Anisodus tanguticus TaxID=243964 RepID=A0AAE1RLP5_9SOLA|nr:hypothetical protein RND71_026844 [Anisodus tanguticus]